MQERSDKLLKTHLSRAVHAILKEEGKLSECLEGYEPRAGQVEMSQAVASAIDGAHTLLVEAGTGTGKSLAYLIPAVLSGRKTIVSTATKALQNQLFAKELPFIRDVLGIDVEVAILKGRTNYLCLHEMGKEPAQHTMSQDMHRWLLHIRKWARTTQTGDRAELAELPDHAPVWDRVSTDAEGCLGERCSSYEQCFLVKARKQAARADVVIVNHHLFFADLAIKERSEFALLPPVETVIFDEAHGIEDVATHYFGRHVSDARIRRMVRDTKAMFQSQPGTRAAVERLEKELNANSDAFFSFFRNQNRQRIDRQTIDDSVKDAWFQLDDSLAALDDCLHSYRGRDESIARVIERCTELRRDIESLITFEDPNMVVWAEDGPRATFIRGALVDVAQLFREVLYPRFDSVVFTSATLAADQAFDHVKTRWGIEDALEAVIESPFDYSKQAALYVPTAHPRPQAPEFTDATAGLVLKVVELTAGNVLALFTSRANMMRVHEKIRDEMYYPLLVQGEAPKEILLDKFRQDPGSVLLATGTFWEGIDVVGEACSAVIIDKLPFSPPDDPLTSARLDRLKQVGINPFMTYQVPSAILSLKQGVGRLIRNRKDKGLIVIGDVRLKQSRYGERFMRSLPNAPQVDTFEELKQSWASFFI